MQVMPVMTLIEAENVQAAQTQKAAEEREAMRRQLQEARADVRGRPRPGTGPGLAGHREGLPAAPRRARRDLRGAARAELHAGLRRRLHRGRRRQHALGGEQANLLSPGGGRADP